MLKKKKTKKTSFQLEFFNQMAQYPGCLKEEKQRLTHDTWTLGITRKKSITCRIAHLKKLKIRVQRWRASGIGINRSIAQGKKGDVTGVKLFYGTLLSLCNSKKY